MPSSGVICLRGNAWVRAVEQRDAAENAQVVSICGALEAEIALLEPAARTEFLSDLGLTEPSLDRLSHSAYRLLSLITYFTAGVQEVRAWTIPPRRQSPASRGRHPLRLRARLHQADAYHSEILFTYGSEQAVKEKGLYRSEGKEYAVEDGHILFFKFNV